MVRGPRTAMKSGPRSLQLGKALARNEDPTQPKIKKNKKKKLSCIYKKEYYSAIKKDEILPFWTTWLDLEGITLNEISQMETDFLEK